MYANNDCELMRLGSTTTTVTASGPGAALARMLLMLLEAGGGVSTLSNSHADGRGSKGSHATALWRRNASKLIWTPWPDAADA